MKRIVPPREQIVAGLLAGIAGGIVMQLFYFLTMLPSGQAVRIFLGTFAFITSVLLGPSALGSPAAVPLGVVLHFCVSIGWALGYVYLTRSQPQLITHPWISGAVFGLVVDMFMNLVLLAAGMYHTLPSREDLTIALLAHVVFYGMTVALVASRLLRASAARSRAAV